MEKQNPNCIHYIVCGMIACLIIIMLGVVVCDRHEFHNRVYEAAYQSAFTMKCQQCNSVAGSSRVSIDSTIVNISNSNQPVGDNTILDALSKSDSLLSANGLTYLVTLIVALLASLLLTKIEAMEKAVSAYKDLKDKLDEAMKQINESTKSLSEIKKQQEVINKFRTQISQSLDEIRKQQKEISNFEGEIGAYYKKTTNYDHILNRIASAFNMSIMISNVTTSLSEQNSNEENRRIATEAGVLCSRLSHICDQIYIKVLTYLTTDEKDILDTYLDDTLNGLDYSLRRAKSIKIEPLSNRIEGNIGLVKEIKEMVDDIEERNE